MYYYKNIAKFFGGSDENDDSAVPKDNKISAKQSNHLPQNQIYTNNPEKELVPQKETVYENKPKEGFKDRAMDMFDEIPSVNGHKGKTYGMDLTGNHGTVWNDLSQTPVGIDSNKESNSVLIDSNENKLNNDKGNQGNIWSGRNEVQPVSNEKIILTPVTDNGVKPTEKPKENKHEPTNKEKPENQEKNPQKKPNEKKPDDFTKKDLDNLLNKKQFWDWLAGWTKKYMDLLNKRLKDMVKQEVANQLQKALHQNPETNNKNNAHGKDNQPKENQNMKTALQKNLHTILMTPRKIRRNLQTNQNQKGSLRKITKKTSTVQLKNQANRRQIIVINLKLKILPVIQNPNRRAKNLHISPQQVVMKTRKNLRNQTVHQIIITPQLMFTLAQSTETQWASMILQINQQAKEHYRLPNLKSETTKDSTETPTTSGNSSEETTTDSSNITTKKHYRRSYLKSS
ncbi:unnamed protein product [Colias eurytheme]|nr:unnamed protein product [Colias eurytheme]